MTSSPAGSSSANPARVPGASAYIPAAQQSADALFQRLLDPANVGSLGDMAVNPQNSPAGQAYQQGQPLVSSIINNPGYPNAVIGTQLTNSLGLSANDLANWAPRATGNAGNMLLGQAPQSFAQLSGYANQVAPMAPAENQILQGYASQLSGLVPSIINQAFDPQGALRAQEENRLGQQVAAGNAFSGVGGTPYGADVANEAMGNFDINWQNNQLQRMLQGAQSAQGLTTAAGGLSSLGATDYGSLYGQAGSLLGQGDNALLGLLTGGANLFGNAQGQYGAGIGNVLSGTGAQTNLGNTQGTTGLNALSSLTNIGNAQYQLPQQVLNDLQSYLGLGQSASALSGQLGQMGLNQLGQAAGGIGSLLGSGLGLGSPSNPGWLGSALGLGGAAGLFGGGAASAAPIVPGIGGAFAISDFTDLLPALALTATA